MKNVQKIIELLGGNEFSHVRLENGGYMPLTIERIGTFGPNDFPLFSVCHYGEQNGDLMADPEMTFAVSPDGRWCPVSFRNDYTGTYQEGSNGAMWFDDDGKPWSRPRLVRDLKSFAVQWNKNIGQQGFVAVAKELAKQLVAAN